MSRLSNLFFMLLGAVGVGVVVAVLAVAGALPERVERVTERGPSLSSPSAPRTAPTSVAGIYANVADSVVFVSARGGNGSLSFEGEGGGQAASGSGFVIDKRGYIVTNQHVVDGASRFTVRFGEEGEPIPATLVGQDPSSDLAVLKIDPKDVKGGVDALELASSKQLKPGDAAIAIGSPFGLSGTVTTGIVSALGREIEAPNGFSIPGAVQTDAAINPGNSGGPLLDADGRVIGVNSQIRSSGGGNTGVGFAVPSDTVKDVVPKLIADGKIERAYIGVSSSEEPSNPGAVVQTVTPGGPASEAGIRAGDVITSFDGRSVRNPSDLSLAVNAKKPGDNVKVQVRRGDSTRTVEIELGTRPDEAVR
jgi:putative serine protease PepD